MSVRVGKSAICKAFWAISGHILGPAVGVRFLVAKSPHTKAFWLQFCLFFNFHFFKKNHRPPSTIFEMFARVDKSAICKAFCVILGHILAPHVGGRFRVVKSAICKARCLQFWLFLNFHFFKKIIDHHPRFSRCPWGSMNRPFVRRFVSFLAYFGPPCGGPFSGG